MKKIRINLGKWFNGSINSKTAQWAKNHGYKVSYDSRHYIHIFTSHNEYVINDAFQKTNGDLIIELITCGRNAASYEKK